MSNKTHALRKHAKRRLDERYGMQVNRHQLRAMAQQVQSGKAKFVDRQSRSRTRWVVTLDDREVFVVYDKTRKVIVTALLKEWAP